MTTVQSGAVVSLTMEIDVDIFCLIIGYLLYRWGKKNGISEGKRIAYQEERLYRMEERFDEFLDKAKPD